MKTITPRTMSSPCFIIDELHTLYAYAVNKCALNKHHSTARPDCYSC